MSDKTSIALEDHIARYCRPGACSGNEILKEAFLPRENERGISVNWAEYFSGSLASQIDQIREDISQQIQLRRGGRFAVLRAGAIREGTTILRVEHAPKNGNPSHAEIRGWPNERIQRVRLALVLKQLVGQGVIFPVLKGE